MISISIITATYNAGLTLQSLVESVILAKQHFRVEFIIIDGKSNDDTLEIIRSNKVNIDYWISEPDLGIYDAWNKGIKMATGNWIMFLGADDALLPDALSNYYSFLDSIDHKDLDLVSSKMRMIDKNGNVIRIKGWSWEWPLFLKEVTIAHPGALHSKKLFDKYGLFNINYKITGDYELLLRPRHLLKSAFMDVITVNMSEGGASDSVAAMREHKRASILTGGQSTYLGNINFLIVLVKFLGKNAFRKIGVNAYLKK